MKDVVYSEAEYSILRKRLLNYTNFLLKSIEDYKQILDFIMEKGVKDDKIKAKILKLKSDVALYPSNIQSINSEVASLWLGYGDALEEADRLDLPDLELSALKVLFSVFQ